MAHNGTVFAQVLKLVPRHEFESLARKHKSGRMSRSMTRWGQFVAMGMAQLTGRCSLRDIVSNLAAQSCKLYHLGVGVVTRSSLARVNAEKPWEMYEELHGRLLGRCQAKAPGHGYRFKAKLFSVDSTTIDLCLSAFPWAKFRRTKGAVKVHVGLDHRPAVVIRKVCGGNRTRHGADTQQVLASIVRSARQRGLDLPPLIAALLRAPEPAVPELLGLPPPTA